MTTPPPGPICPRCGKVILPEERYCGRCGEPIEPEARASRARTQQAPRPPDPILAELRESNKRQQGALQGCGLMSAGCLITIFALFGVVILFILLAAAGAFH